MPAILSGTGYDRVILADLSAYLLFQSKGLEIGYSEHYRFNRAQGTFRFFQRVDGKPWLRSAITLSDPQGSFTVSPFVYLDD
jgi:HK97 family phage major capsid protein